jgi:CRISPR type III-B/RAMP module RAMP protein Cmr1
MVTAKSLTPLWTGGVEQKGMRIKESGFIGSMRFWASRLFDKGQVAELFGNTEQARSFRLHIVGLSAVPIREKMPEIMKYAPRAVYYASIHDKTALWGHHSTGEFSLHFYFRYFKGGLNELIRRLQQTLLFMERHTGAGARTQYGFGQFSIVSGVDRSIAIPSAAFFASATFRAKAANISFAGSLNVKKQLLPQLNPTRRIELLGGVIPPKNRQGTRYGSRLHIAYPYPEDGRSLVKVWCFREKNDRPSAPDVLNEVRSVMGSNWDEVQP